MSHAYQQIQMDEQSKKYLTVNTHHGLFKYNRLPFGVSSAPAIFQRTMEGVLQGIPQVFVYLDNILVTGATREMHLRTLDEVLTRLEDTGLRLKRSKCTLLTDWDIKWMLKEFPLKKVKAVFDAPTPTTVTELKAYLGLLHYYKRFLPNLSTLQAPLHYLLRKDVVWRWGDCQEEAFVKSKDLLKSARALFWREGPNIGLQCLTL